MNHTEATLLCRYVQACCPAQKIDPLTFDAWWDLLGDLDYNEAKTAATAVARRQPFVAPAEIRAQVRADHARLLESTTHQLTPPPSRPATPERRRQYLAALKAAIHTRSNS